MGKIIKAQTMGADGNLHPCEVTYPDDLDDSALANIAMMPWSASESAVQSIALELKRWRHPNRRPEEI